MSNFIRTNEYLHIKDKNKTIKFIKTSSSLEQAHNNIILFNNNIPYSHMKHIDSISYDVEFLYEHKIIPHILYCDRNYVKKHYKLINKYLLEYGEQINEIYLSKEILNYDFNYNNNNEQYFEDIEHFDNITDNNGAIDIGLLGIILSLYLNYTRVCYTFDIDITLDSISKLKKVKETYHLENKISVYNCSDIDNPYLKKQPIHHILKPIVLIQQFFIHRDDTRQEELVELGGEQRQVDFGSQIRSYVLQPYQMVKDLRTEREVGNVDSVLDGDLDGFMETYLRWFKEKET